MKDATQTALVRQLTQILREIQEQLASEPVSTREGYARESIRRVLDGVPANERPAFLAALQAPLGELGFAMPEGDWNRLCIVDKPAVSTPLPAPVQIPPVISEPKSPPEAVKETKTPATSETAKPTPRAPANPPTEQVQAAKRDTSSERRAVGPVQTGASPAQAATSPVSGGGGAKSATAGAAQAASTKVDVVSERLQAMMSLKGRPQDERVCQAFNAMMNFAMDLDDVVWKMWWELAPDQKEARPSLRAALERFLVEGRADGPRGFAALLAELQRQTVAMTAAAVEKGNVVAPEFIRQFSPAAIQTAADAPQARGANVERYWNKYREIAEGLDADTLREQINDATRQAVLDIVRQ